MAFRIPEIPYSCILCGECCREPWALVIDDAAVDRLQRIDWTRHRRDLPPDGGAALFPGGNLRCYREAAGRRVLPRTEAGCAFLEPAGTCFLHRVFGPDMKPNGCVEFPYAFADTPGGTFLGLSFACRAVRESVVRMAEAEPLAPAPADSATGNLSGEAAEAYRRAAVGSERSRPFPDSIRLEEGIPLDWDEYLALEGALDAVLAAPGRPLAERLVAGEVFLGLLADYARAAGAADDSARRTEVVNHYVATMAGDGRERLFHIAARIRPSRQTRQVVVSLFRAFAGAAGHRRPDSRFGALRLSCLWLGRLLRRLLRPPRVPIPDTVEERILSLYLRHLIWRKGLLVGASPYFTGVVRRGYAHLLIVVALILEEWGARSKHRPRRETLLDAIRVVERDFVLHGARRTDVPVQELVGRYRFPLHLLDALTHRRFFARSMLG